MSKNIKNRHLFGVILFFLLIQVSGCRAPTIQNISTQQPSAITPVRDGPLSSGNRENRPLNQMVSWDGKTSSLEAHDISSAGEEDAIATAIPHDNSSSHRPNLFSTAPYAHGESKTLNQSIKILFQETLEHPSNQNNTDRNIHIFPTLGNELKESS